MGLADIMKMLADGTKDTLIMVLFSTLFGYLFGLPLGVLLSVTGDNGLKPMPLLYRVLDVVINIARSIPFLILLILIQPFTKTVVGKSYGTLATVVPLTVAAIPFIARMVESSLKEVDAGVIEAALSLGASKMTIITKVLIAEARTSLLIGVTIATGTILGYSAMAGIVGGGGLGDIAIRYGYYRYETEIMIVTVVVIVLFMQLFQWFGMLLSKKCDRRKR